MSGAAELGSRLRAIALWQAGLVAAAALVSLASGRGSPIGLAGGAALLHLSTRLNAVALGAALRAQRRPALAIAALVAKLALLIGVAVVGLSSGLFSAISFCVGAATLPVAIVLDACYGARPRTS